MKAASDPAIQEAVSPNLIPMIDIMFLLLLFFMLGADMGQRELEEVQVPNAQSATPMSPEAPRDWTTINVFHRQEPRCPSYTGPTVCRDPAHWRWSVRGREVDNTEALASLIGPADRAPAATDPGGRKVMIRADAQAPYGMAQRAMNLCAQFGISRIEVSASPKRGGEEPAHRARPR